MIRRRLTSLTVIGWAAAAALLSALLPYPSAAQSPARPDAARAWRDECGSCHIAYAPRLLPAESWRVVLDRLDQHYGVDASLDPARVAQIRSYLVAEAGLPGRAPAPGRTPRISTAPWFDREHAEVAAEVWRRPSVRSRSNCGACHSGAERGAFNEDGIRIPK